MGQKTALGSLLKAIGNSGQGKVVPGWGAVPVMTVIGLLLLVFLVILLALTGCGLWTAFGPKAAKLTDPWDDHDD